MASSGVLLSFLSLHLFLAGCVCPSCFDTPSYWGFVCVVSIVPSSARRITSHELRPLSSGRWFSGSEAILLNYRREFSISRIVLAPEFVAMTEEKRLRPNPGTFMAEIRTGTRCPACSTMHPQIVTAAANNVSLPAVPMVFGFSSFLKSLMLSCSLGFNSVRAAVHNHRKPASV